MKIKVRLLNEKCDFTENTKRGDWIDLKSATTTTLKRPYPSKAGGLSHVKFSNGLLPLGVAMEIPKGYEAIVVPRSSSFKNFGFIQTNSIGVIDNSYNGDNDQWHLPILQIIEKEIKEGDRVCQFRIQLSQEATVWQRIKWIFTSRIKFIKVDSLNNKDRGGFGSTGVSDEK